MKKPLHLFCIAIAFVLPGLWEQVKAQEVFINEIHYDNDGADSSEGIEIAGPVGTDLSGYSLIFYNGNNGSQYITVNLSGTISSQQGGYGTSFFSIAGIQNGSPDGVALLKPTNEVSLFISYEGTITAVDGPANGLTSTDIGVSEVGGTATGLSLQLSGEGTEYSHFSWNGPATGTYNQPNLSQTFSGTDNGGGGDGGDNGGGDEEPAETIVFINEIHYDNTGTDTEEGIEIAGLAGTDLSGWTLVLYNGNNSATYKTVALTGQLEDQQAGWGTKFFSISGIQNGSPDGVALVNAGGEVVQFLSYEGSFTAAGGPADGMLSEDIGVEEGSSTANGFSLQVTGEGSAYTDFEWAEAQASTYNEVNANQVFLPIVPIVFVNEVHYDNAGSDVNEGLEIAGTAGTDLSAYSLVLYNGNNGVAYKTVSLEGELPNLDNGYGTLFFFISGIQNGGPDGIALVELATEEVIQFLSYEGSFTAVGGPADGMESEDIGVEETSGTPSGYSLQLAGEGRKYEDFSWKGPLSNTYNQINANQSFGGEIVTPEPMEVTIAEARDLSIGKQVIVYGTLTATSQLGGPAFMQDNTAGIAVYDEQIHANPSLQIGDSLRIEATIGAFNNQIQLVEVTSFEVFGQAAEQIQPKEVNVAELASVEGELVQVQATFSDARGLLFPNSNYQIADASGTSDVRIDDNVESLIGRLVPQGEVSITGVVGSFQGNMQIFPRFAADLPAAEPYEPEGDTIPAATTFDVATWNMEFFGATQQNFGPADIQLQMENAVKVLEALEADIIAIQEVSSDSLLNVLAGKLEGNWAIRCSDVYSYSFEPVDPNFPAQKLCYLYNTDVIEVVKERVVFEEFYTEIRTTGDESLLPGYPTSVQSFWASGRLPYQLTVKATVEGVTEVVNLFNIHGISNSGGVTSYNRRTYDVQVLKDTLDTYFAGEAIIVLGDYNDDVDEPVADEVSSPVSPYAPFVDAADYAVTTKSLSDAGFRSYVFQDNMIDHIAISDELFAEWIEGSEITFIPFNIVDNYSSTTSDHLPVKVRFELIEPIVVTTSEDQQVYFGYDPEACTTLSASATGGKGTLTYTWSTGETGQSIEVCPSMSQVYTVTVSDGYGNSASEEVYVCVTDVSCSNGIGQEKVELCHTVGRWGKQVSLCLPEFLVPFFLERGAMLGSCEEQGACEETENRGNPTARTASAQAQYYAIDEVLSIYQKNNGSENFVQFVVLEEGASELKLFNAAGQQQKVLYKGNDPFGSVQQISIESDGLSPGIYYLQLRTQSGETFNKKLKL